MIEIKVDGQIASVQNTLPLYSGSADIQNCHFVFGSDWNGFEKSAVFRVGSEIHTKLVDDDGCCAVPWELLTHRNVGRQLEVGVYGVAPDTEIMTSVWDTLGVIREGTEPGSDARNPVDGIYEQIMAKLGQIREAVTEYEETVRTLTQRSETAAGLAGESAQLAKDDLEELRALVEEYGGIPGDSPYIGENGNWWIGGLDTEVKAQSEDGKSAYEYARDGGYSGTEEEFAAKLAAQVYSRSEADERFLSTEGGELNGALGISGAVTADSYSLSTGGGLAYNDTKLMVTTRSGATSVHIRPYGLGSTAGIEFGLSDVTPEVSKRASLGKSNRLWKNLYLSGNLSDGTNTRTIANIAQKSDLPSSETWVFTLEDGSVVTKKVCVT